VNIAALPRFPLAQLPTPLECLPRLSRQLGGPRLLIKRDDQTGLALGGNKTRKLEFLVGQALAQGADTLITAGAAQSNHCRQTAAAAARSGLRCHLLLNQNRPEHVLNGNLLLDGLLGAAVHWIERRERAVKLDQLSVALRDQKLNPYVIGVGGSNGVGATGYVLAMMELMDQLRASQQHVDHIFFGSSSGGTQAGMVLGAKIAGFSGKLHGVGIDKDDRDRGPYEDELAQIANECAEYIGSDLRLTKSDFEVVYGYVGGGYGVVGDLEREAIRLAAAGEGIILDPVYAGRAFGAMLDLIRKGVFKRDETVLFWHTGGAPALFAYAADLG
jgi:D-cysteine desulfhydrase